MRRKNFQWFDWIYWIFILLVGVFAIVYSIVIGIKKFQISEEEYIQFIAENKEIMKSNIQEEVKSKIIKDNVYKFLDKHGVSNDGFRDMVVYLIKNEKEDKL